MFSSVIPFLLDVYRGAGNGDNMNKTLETVHKEKLGSGSGASGSGSGSEQETTAAAAAAAVANEVAIPIAVNEAPCTKLDDVMRLWRKKMNLE